MVKLTKFNLKMEEKLINFMSVKKFGGMKELGQMKFIDLSIGGGQKKSSIEE